MFPNLPSPKHLLVSLGFFQCRITLALNVSLDSDRSLIKSIRGSRHAETTQSEVSDLDLSPDEIICFNLSLHLSNSSENVA